MRSPFMKTGLTVLTLLVASCGGGSEPLASSQEVTCTQAWTWANPSGQGSQSFSPKPIAPAEVQWELQGCSIQRLSSAQLTVCIDHSQTSELILKLYRGTETTPLTLPRLNETSQSGACGPGAPGRPWTYAITDSNFISATASQRWRLVVADEVNNQNTGDFVGWSFIAKGFH
jgi:hypothetical protein